MSEQKMREGWKLLPVEPTPEMIDAIRNGYGWKAAYSAMLAAAPEPPRADTYVAPSGCQRVNCKVCGGGS